MSLSIHDVDQHELTLQVESTNTTMIELNNYNQSRPRQALLQRLLPWGILLHVAFAGCSQQHRAPDVEPQLARSTLIEVLETWKAGGTINELRQRDPEIVVQEFAWSSGHQLQSYELLDTGREEDANLFCEVKLTLVETAGTPPRQKTVTYVIGTEPALTVFRAML